MRAPPAGPAYDSVAGLAAALTDGGLPCTLLYPGLHDGPTGAETGTCSLAGDQAQLRVWASREASAGFLSSPAARTGTVVAGANWTVTVSTVAAARAVAAALGGLVPTPPPARPDGHGTRGSP